MKPPKKSILLVEDDEQLRTALKDKLDIYQIYEAGDGEQAMALCMDYHPDLIVLDLLLPKLDGFKVLERIRSYPDPKIALIPVVVLSNLWSQKDILQVQGLKISEYFVKSHSKLEDVVIKAGEILTSHV